MAEKTIFQKIADREIPGDIIYEDDLCLCFRDIAPQAPVHLLLVPKKLIVRIGEADPADQDLLGHLLTRIRIIAEQEGLSEDGFRVVLDPFSRASIFQTSSWTPKSKETSHPRVLNRAPFGGPLRDGTPLFC